MPYTAEQKAAAAANQEAVSYAAATVGMAGAGGALIPVAGPFVAAGCGVLSGALALRAIQQGRIVRDPARDDYDEQTTLGPVRFNISDLAETSVEMAVADLVSTTDELTRLIEANVLAVERSDGARDPNALSGRAYLGSRTDEALGFAAAIAGRLGRSSFAARGAASALQDRPPEADISEYQPHTVVDALERLARADEQWAEEIRRGLSSRTFLDGGFEGTTSV
jgi:hypothetical protein